MLSKHIKTFIRVPDPYQVDSDIHRTLVMRSYILGSSLTSCSGHRYLCRRFPCHSVSPPHQQCPFAYCGTVAEGLDQCHVTRAKLMWELHCVLEMIECCFKILISVKAEWQENQTILQMFVYSQYFTTVHTLWRLRILEWRQRVTSSWKNLLWCLKFSISFLKEKRVAR